MSVKVTIKDTGADALFLVLKDLRGLSITVGFQTEKGGKIHPLATVNVATIALYNEFGTITGSPARPFMRTTLIEGKDKIAAEAALQFKRAIVGEITPVEASSRLGAFIVKLMRERIDKAGAWAVPNALSTVKKKGHAMPLLGGDPRKKVARGTMRDSLTWAVRRGGSILAEGK